MQPQYALIDKKKAKFLHVTVTEKEAIAWKEVSPYNVGDNLAIHKNEPASYVGLPLATLRGVTISFKKLSGSTLPHDLKKKMVTTGTKGERSIRLYLAIRLLDIPQIPLEDITEEGATIIDAVIPGKKRSLQMPVKGTLRADWWGHFDWLYAEKEPVDRQAYCRLALAKYSGNSTTVRVVFRNWERRKKEIEKVDLYSAVYK